MSRFPVDPASTKIAAILVACLVLLIILSSIIPQKEIAESRIVDWERVLGDRYSWIERLQLDRIYQSPIFFALRFP